MQANPTKSTTRRAPERPTGLNHVVLNVRDIGESHRFWTEILGFQHVGSLRPRSGQDTPRLQMRFYSADHDGHLSHHDIALIERSALWADGSAPRPLMDHIAIAMADRDSWLRQLDYLESRGIALTARFKRGVSESVHVTDPNGHDIEILYELPRAVWERDIETSLNTSEALETNKALIRSADDRVGT
ncbi:MAG: VOC family protein [Alphaproteobacteria bacterium]|nr:VOC family protein [Alphaproteobacteria bacterium]